jgi:DNA-directed RNA polymerase subunit RPC12/RpoP
MPETIVRCPGCGAKLKLGPAAQGKKAIRCPKCGGTVPVPQAQPAPPKPAVKAAEPVEELEEVEPVVAAAEPAPMRKKGRPADEDEDEPPARPVKRRRPIEEEDEEDDEDDRPRGRRKQPKKQPPGPWPLALGVAAACGLLGFVFPLLILGTAGLPESKDGGPVGDLCGIGLLLVVCPVLIVLGVLGVKNRHTVGKWGIEITGTTAIWVGMIQAFFGGLLGGVAVYGLIFAVIHLFV